jgi:hypothetical protein
MNWYRWFFAPGWYRKGAYRRRNKPLKHPVGSWWGHPYQPH